jgi:hypothetical protein
MHPARIQAALYQAFDIQALYKDDMNQVSLFALITTSTPKPSPPSWPTPATTPPPSALDSPSPRRQRPRYPLAQPPISH